MSHASVLTPIIRVSSTPGRRALATVPRRAAPRTADSARPDLIAEPVAPHGMSRAEFESRWQQHRPLVRKVLSTMRGAKPIEDLTQEVALRAWRFRESIEAPDRFGQWLAAIARNVGRSALVERRPDTEQSIEEVQEVAASEVDDPSATTELVEIQACIDGLPRAYRDSLRMRLCDGLSCAEIAEHRGLTVGSVRVNLCRGMKILRNRLTAMGLGCTAC